MGIVLYTAANEFPLQGSLDAKNSMGEKSSSFLLALLEYMLKNDKEFAKAFSKIPRNAMYTSQSSYF